MHCNYHYQYLCNLSFLWLMFRNIAEGSYVAGGQAEYYCLYDKSKCPTTQATPSEKLNCKVPSDGVLIEEGSKYIFFNQKFSWESCRDKCKKHGLEIASIKSLEEQQLVEKFIHSFIKRGEYPEKNSSVLYGTFWFGANDYKTEGSFHWINGDEIQFQKFWYHNPNNDKKYSGGKYGEHCVELIYFPNTTESWWNDQLCGQKKPFLCEFPESNVDCFSVPPYEEPVKIPKLTEVGNTGFYSSGTLQLNWTEAYNFCEDEGFSLVSVHDSVAVNAISNVVKQDVNPFTHYWTSGVFSSRCCDKKNFQYETLNWLTMQENLNYKRDHLRWWKKEPSDEGGVREENCIEFLHLGNGDIEFSACHCSLPLQFICTKKSTWGCRCPTFLY